MKIFKTNFTVRIGDINYGGHMGNDKFLLIFQDARLRFLESLGFGELDIGEGAGLIMTEAHIKYRKEVFLNDFLTVTVKISTLKQSSFNTDFSVERDSDGATVVSGYSALVAFNYQKRHICKLPQPIRSALKEFEL